MAEVTEELTVINTLGLHARPAATLVERVLPFNCEVYMQMKGMRVNAKSIMGLLTLAAAQGSKIMVSCEGPDAEAALEAIRELLASGFGED